MQNAECRVQNRIQYSILHSALCILIMFPQTHVSLVEALSSQDSPARVRAVDMVVAAYRAPVIAVLRRQWSLEMDDAEDLAHDFFVHALEREWLSRYDREKGRFRTFLRRCLQDFASTKHEASRRLKRGGHLQAVSLDDASGVATAADVDRLFDQEWARSVLTLSLERLREECVAANRQTTYDVFVAHDVEDTDEPPRYAALASRFGIPVTQVANYLHWARTRFRVHALDTLRALTASDAEFREEARALLGREPDGTQ
jgi:DNA-directed RNA polymerase specialized sigma24 family protein